MQPKVPPETTSADRRVAKWARDLKPGDWLSVDRTTFESDLDEVEGPIEVLAITAYIDPIGSDRVLAVLRLPGEASPRTARWWDDLTVWLATAEEIEQVRIVASWNEAADALVRVADALRAMRIGNPGLSVDIFPAGPRASDEQKIAAVDAVCQAVFGAPGATRENTSDHKPYRQGRGNIGPLHLSVAAQLAADGGCE